MRQLHSKKISYPIESPFTISRGTKTHADAVIVTIKDNGYIAQAECIPYAHYKETQDSAIAQIEKIHDAVENPTFSRHDLLNIMPAGAARNAVDCALFSLEAQQNNIPTWQLAGLKNPPKKVVTAYTISLDTADIMAQKAKEAAETYHLLKIKLGTFHDEERIAKIRESVHTKTRLIVDANEGWSSDDIERYMKCAEKYCVEMIEQPIPVEQDSILEEYKKFKPPSVSLCADESFHSYNDLDTIVKKYDMINIKLDKTGGLTEALKIQKKACSLNLKIMIGCMLGSSLSMAPAILIAQNADVVDLDGPLLLSHDHTPALHYEKSYLYPAPKELWG